MRFQSRCHKTTSSQTSKNNNSHKINTHKTQKQQLQHKFYTSNSPENMHGSNNNQSNQTNMESSQTRGASLNLSSAPKNTRPKLEKRVSIDLMPMTLEEIEWAMADAKMQEEEREIQEMRERIQRRKEARQAAALANAVSQ